MSSPSSEGIQVLICAPYGRDAEEAEALIRRAGHDAMICADLDQIAAALGPGTGAVLITDDALKSNRRGLVDALAGQPDWSDIPFVLLIARQTRQGGTGEPAIHRQSLPTTNVILMERPLSSRSLLSSIDTALKNRARQFQIRDRLEDLRRARETLEQQVADRTAALQAEMDSRLRAEAALRQSQKMEAVGQLTGGIAHDFNNMLTGVIGSLDMVSRRLATGRVEGLERYIGVAAASANRAAALTQRLLAFSRRQSLDAKPVEINRLIRAMDELLERAIDEDVALHFDLADNLPNAVADANQLESAVLNLAINARDAMPSGGRLTIRTSVVDLDRSTALATPELKPGRYVAVAIVDTGVGMTPELIEKVFDPFFTTKPLGQGTGLGLSMVYGFAQQSGGTVGIESTPEVGTTVTILLPSTDIVASHEAGPQASALEGDGQRVLVVEDDDAVRMLVREVLEELRYRAIEFADPLAAAPYLASDARIDLMISDVGMPGMNGRELAETARAHRPDLPILFITGYAENAAIRADFLGANMSMVAKPFSLSDLAAKVSEIMQARPAEPA